MVCKFFVQSMEFLKGNFFFSNVKQQAYLAFGLIVKWSTIIKICNYAEVGFTYLHLQFSYFTFAWMCLQSAWTY